MNKVILCLLLLFWVYSIYMLIRNYFVCAFRDRVWEKDARLWLALLPYNSMLYRVHDWKFRKMLRPDFYKYSGLTKSELLEMLKDV